MSVSTPSIVLENVTKQYGQGATIIDNLSATIQPGEFVSIIGPSGCGKSTLLKLVAGLSPITSGRIAMDGLTRAEARRVTSFIFQDATLLPWRTVRQNVGLGLELEHAPKVLRNETADAMLKLVGLADVADKYPRELSGGMKMRVSIARALASKPRVLLLDEPFAALDEITRDRMNEELLRLREQHAWTVLFVTHSVAEAVFLSSRILVLAAHPGRLKHDIAVPLSWPRAAGTRDSVEFDDVVSRVSRTLREVQGQ